MTAVNRPAIFDEVVAGWDERIPCVWVSTTTGKPCQRGAHWNLDAHGCFGGTLCGHHFWEWHRDNFGGTRCVVCDHTFPSFLDAFTARKL